MKKLKYIIPMLIGATFFACTDLDEKAYDRLPGNEYPENDDQIATAPVAAYQPLNDFLDWGGWWFSQELTSDEMVCPTRHTDWDDGGKWRVLHTHTWTNTTEANSAMWGTFYKGIAICNQKIEGLAPTAGTEAGKTVIAKLKVLRAFYYYLLIDNYGDVPYVAKFNGAPAQPFKESRAAVCDSIIKDITANIKYLPSTLPSKSAVTKGMAYSLLAKIYLNSEVYTGTPQWLLAEQYCDSVINMNVYSLSADRLAPFVTENQTSPENIFTIGYDEDNAKGFNLHMRTLHYESNKTYDMSVGPWNGFAAMEAHYNSYSSDDKRKAYFIVGQQYDAAGQKLIDPGAANALLVIDPYIVKLQMDASNTLKEIRMSGARVKKFEIKLGAKDNLSNDFPLFRYADIILMKAEALIRQGKDGDAYVNEIREKAGVTPFVGATLTDILAERGREMFWEAHRRQDLIRFGKFNDAWWEKPASAPSRKTFPIPQSAIDANPNLAK